MACSTVVFFSARSAEAQTTITTNLSLVRGQPVLTGTPGVDSFIEIDKVKVTIAGTQTGPAQPVTKTYQINIYRDTSRICGHSPVGDVIGSAVVSESQVSFQHTLTIDIENQPYSCWACRIESFNIFIEIVPLAGVGQTSHYLYGMAGACGLYNPGPYEGFSCPAPFRKSYSNPKRSNIRLAGGYNFQFPWAEDTSAQFCFEGGFDSASGYQLAYPTGSTYTYYSGSSWGVSGRSDVHLFTSLTCEIGCPTYDSFSNPTRNGIRLAGGYSFSFPWKENTMNQYCIEKGYAAASGSNLGYPTPSTYAYYTGSGWSVSGRSDVHLFSSITCVR